MSEQETKDNANVKTEQKNEPVAEAKKATPEAVDKDNPKNLDEAAGVILDYFIDSVPEKMRNLIPKQLNSLEKMQWIIAAQKAGLFAASEAPKNSPDAKRPTAKIADDLNNLSPVEMMARGYK